MCVFTIFLKRTREYMWTHMMSRTGMIPILWRIWLIFSKTYRKHINKYISYILQSHEYIELPVRFPPKFWQDREAAFVLPFCIGGKGRRKWRESNEKVWIHFRNMDKDIFVNCGCFCGNIDEFLLKVFETHGENRYAMEYKAVAEAAKAHMKEE